ncbi:MAG: hypothetical protein HQK77_07965 [Desulfobacterales bacterium]|nr:hypothetical protein [Desulfobacterales bacterium]
MDMNLNQQSSPSTLSMQNEKENMIDELRELDELSRMKTFLETEYRRLSSELLTLDSEMESMQISISSAEAYMGSYEGQQNRYLESIDKLSQQKETIIFDINTLHTQIKTGREEAETSRNLADNLKIEIQDVDREKNMILQRLSAVQTGLQQIETEKNMRKPNLQWYDNLLKEVYSLFREAQNRMDVMLLMSKDRNAVSLPLNKRR